MSHTACAPPMSHEILCDHAQRTSHTLPDGSVMWVCLRCLRRGTADMWAFSAAKRSILREMLVSALVSTDQPTDRPMNLDVNRKLKVVL
jgi:hypothetical protein